MQNEVTGLPKKHVCYFVEAKNPLPRNNSSYVRTSFPFFPDSLFVSCPQTAVLGSRTILLYATTTLGKLHKNVDVNVGGKKRKENFCQIGS